MNNIRDSVTKLRIPFMKFMFMFLMVFSFSFM